MQIQLCKRLQDALDAITAIEGFLANQSVEDFLGSDILQAAVERKFEIIGEALKKAAEADDEIETLVPPLEPECREQAGRTCANFCSPCLRRHC
jgi:uncharacterized protein with HEPN domain